MNATSLLIGMVTAIAGGGEPPAPTAGSGVAGSDSVIEGKAATADFAVSEYRGNVVSYKPAFERLTGIGLAGSGADDLLALRTEDGQLLPILPTRSAQFFYDDPRNLGRLMHVSARVYERTPGIHLLTIHSVRGGKLNEIYYWCDVCGIQSFRLQDCDCCQGPVELREHPVGERYHPKSLHDDQ